MHPSVARERATAHDDGRNVGVAIGPHPPEKLVWIVPIPRGDVGSWVLWKFAASIDGHVQIGRDLSRHPRILPHRDLPDPDVPVTRTLDIGITPLSVKTT